MNDIQRFFDDKKEIIEKLPNLPDKFIVDFANGIDVAKDHVRVKRSRGGFFDRFCDSIITGKDHRRQNEINMCLIDGLEGSLRWLTEVTESLSLTNIAVIKAFESIDKIQSSQSKIIDYSIETRKSLNELNELFQSRVKTLEKEIKRIDFEQKAKRHMDSVLDKWKASKLNDFSIAGRVAAVLEELRWGDFGYFITKVINDQRTRLQFLADLENKLIIRTREELGGNEAFETKFIMKSDKRESELIDALAYLSNWANPEESPIIYLATQFPEEYPRQIAHIYNPATFSKHVVSEVFEGGNHEM
ncbi:MAG TPA: diguanylate cyclase regulator RdcB family protein [bacterium]|jgi:hypothetical protein|nr:diguanylate cyclase regulator RdcB family protein [bacterium]